MQTEEDRAYYRQRAADERRAAVSPVECARVIHAELAQRYTALASRPVGINDED